ncbi:MAG: putative Ig domain-containing protein [Myxococcales bacterium]|nr:putative Ig domain-containing protein [Myxococcales bacterium]
MRLRPLLASMGTVLLALSGCTSDLPAPHNFEVVDPPPPDNELGLDCAAIPLTANDADFAYLPEITGLIDGVKYVYGAEGLPEGLAIDENTGEISGTVAADAGAYTFAITVTEVDVDRDPYAARTECTLDVNPRIIAPLSIDTVPYCLGGGTSLLSLVQDGTGDGTPINCSYRPGNGNGRKPTGIEVDAQSSTLTGTIDETRYGTWVFIMEGEQSGATVHVPFCVTNDVAQGYQITADHSGATDVALRPIMRTYDPSQSFTVGMDGDPRFNIESPGSCGASCYYRYSFLRTTAPIADDGYSLEPDGLLQDAMMNTVGFFHELRVSGPAVPEEFQERPWVLSSAVSYCITDQMGGCGDPAADGDGALEFGLVMVPDRG